MTRAYGWHDRQRMRRTSMRERNVLLNGTFGWTAVGKEAVTTSTVLRASMSASILNTQLGLNCQL